MTFTKSEETYRETRASDEMVVGEQVTLSTLVILIRKTCVSSDFGKSIPQESSLLHICYRSLDFRQSAQSTGVPTAPIHGKCRQNDLWVIPITSYP